MGGLKKVFCSKIKASSLMEVIVATTILLTVFAIAIFTLNNLLLSTVQKETQSMETQLEKLRYQYTNQQLKIPISYREDEFIIAVQKMNQNKQQFVVFSITNSKTNKSVTKKQLFYETSKTISQ